MENKKLIKCGIDLVNTITEYLAKDATGGDFLKKYLDSRNEQAHATEKQEVALQNLMSGMDNLEESHNIIAKGVSENGKRLQQIQNEVRELKNSVNAIEQEQRRYVEQLKNLTDRAKMISGQINDIQDISAQTNLLSFNASIEAARAGNAGKGFRVIANEVKKLSGDTNKTSEEIKNNVENLVKSISTLEEITKSNSVALDTLAKRTDETIATFDSVRNANIAVAERVSETGKNSSENVQKINGIVQNIRHSKDLSTQNLEVFADCASKNSMLFNDLYSFVNQLKAIFKDLQTQID